MNKSSYRARYLSVLVATTLVAAVIFGVSASAGASSPPGADASAALANLKQVKSGKLSSRLLRLSQSSVATASLKEQAAAIGLPSSGPGSLLRKAGGKQVLVYLRIDGSVASARSVIENAGATVVHVSKRYGVVTAAVSPSRLQALAKLPQVANAREALAPMYSAACPTGVVSEGDAQLGASSARSTFGVDGSGVPVGILSDSYDDLGGASTGVLNANLPGTSNPCGYTTPVDILEDDTGADEGRAMLEVVHDLAPGSDLSFATANNGLFGMADNILWLRDAGAKVIADDITYFAEPMFQKGPIDLAIDDVTASGVPYFSSGGNTNLVVGGNNVGSYESISYRPTSCPAELSDAGFDYADCHDFNPLAGTDSGANYTLAAGGYLWIDFQWAEPWDGVSTDLDIFLFDADTGELLDFSDDANPGGGTQIPFEFMASYQNDTGVPENVEVVIARYSGTATPRIKYVINRSHGVTSVEHNGTLASDTVGPTIFGHNGGQNTISMAAVPYNDATTPETYSSHGPVTYYFGPADGSGTAAAALPSPQVLSKPDLAATDCAQTSFFYGSGPPFRFCGTSESAPHAAAVAALMLERNPALSPAQVLSRLQSTADAVTNGGTSDVVGSGLIDALGVFGVSTPTFGFFSPRFSISENGGSATITITRSGSTTATNTVHVSTANGTAVAGSDYTAVSQDVSFAPGVISRTVSVPITDDSLGDGNKTVVLFLSSPSSGAEVGGPSMTTLTIVDDDVVLALSSDLYSVNENRGPLTITVNRTGSTSSAVSVHFATADLTAVAGSDYTAVSQDVSFAAGETSKTVSIPIPNDDMPETSRAFLLALSSPSAGATLGSPSTATAGIVDDDSGFSLSSENYSVKESGGSATITINRVSWASLLTSKAVSVNFTTNNGTARAGRDYVNASQIVTFAVGESSKSVSVPIIDDATYEGNETVLLSISSPSEGATLFYGPSMATLTILDNDKPGKIVSAGLSKTSFRRSQVGKIKLALRFSPRSSKFDYLLTFKKGSKWLTMKSVKKTGAFSGTRTYTVKALFAGKAIKAGQYRLKLSADSNSKQLTFRVT